MPAPASWSSANAQPPLSTSPWPACGYASSAARSAPIASARFVPAGQRQAGALSFPADALEKQLGRVPLFDGDAQRLLGVWNFGAISGLGIPEFDPQNEGEIVLH